MGIRPEKPKTRPLVHLAVERLEGRDLPTLPTLLAGPAAAVNLRALAAASPPSETAGPRIPTPHEVARQRFGARFSGSFITGPGRYTDQSSQTFIKGGGISTAFLHGDLQMAVYTPVDPAAPTTGTAALIVKNVADSGNLLVLDLQGDTASLDRAGRPTRFTWTVSDLSGGTFSGASGEGTVEIRYWAGGNLPPRALSSGGAGVIFRGRIETNGVTDILR